MAAIICTARPGRPVEFITSALVTPSTSEREDLVFLGASTGQAHLEEMTAENVDRVHLYGSEHFLMGLDNCRYNSESDQRGKN